MVWDSICHYDVCAVVGYLASWARVDVASLSFSDRWDDADDDSHYSTGSRVSHNSSKKSSDRLARHQESAQHHHRLSSSSSSARAAQHRTSGSTSLRQQQQHSSATYSYSSRSRAGAPTTSTDVARRMIQVEISISVLELLWSKSDYYMCIQAVLEQDRLLYSQTTYVFLRSVTRTDVALPGTLAKTSLPFWTLCSS